MPYNKKHQGRLPSVIIIGAGIGGLCCAIDVKAAGVRELTVLERSDEVGGTWHANRYPGVAVDTSILTYSLSFDSNPGWRRLYASGSDLHDYLVGLSHKYGLREHVRFGVAVEELRWDGAEGLWTVSTDTGEVLRAQVVIVATGVLSTPKIPAILGLDSFEGTVLHSADWDTGFTARGRRIAQVGSGASAAQVVPELAKDADALYVLQRSAAWVLPRNDRLITAREQYWYRRCPWLLKAKRWRQYWANDRVSLGFERQDRTLDKQERIALEFLERSVPDPDLRRHLRPDYRIGCKRRVMSDDWYAALIQPHVELIPHALREVKANSVVATDGSERKVDTIVFSTGFAVEQLVPLKVFGKQGIELHETWADGSRSHLGITVDGFPNLFFVMGPNTGIGSGSAAFMIEAQSRYIAQALRHFARHRLHSIEVDPAVAARSYHSVQRRLAKSVYGSGCSGWYQGENGRIDTLWPGMLFEYWLRTRRFNPAHFRAVRAGLDRRSTDAEHDTKTSGV
ncbi:flavin-containing monooxygenase [Mycolicibacterium sp.]|uniref:flavin-containing monooxygenase n=1 Tax=Mycolicibacterium sp. TaxID=2320850 RepID=UPI0037C8E131